MTAPAAITTLISPTGTPSQNNWELIIHSVQEVTELAAAVLELPGAGLRPDVAKLRAGVLAECALPVRDVFQLWTVTVKNVAHTVQPLTINFNYRRSSVRLLDEGGAPLPARLVGVFIKDQDATLHLIMDGQATYQLKAQQAVDFAFIFDLPAGTMGRLALLDLPAHAFPVTAPIAATPPVASLVSTEGLRIVHRHSCSTHQMTMPYFDRLTGERSEKTLVATRGRLLTIGLTLSGPQDPIVLEEIGLVDCTGQRYEPVQFRQGYEWYYLRDPDHLTLGTPFYAEFRFHQPQFEANTDIVMGKVSARRYHFPEAPGQEVGVFFVFDVPVESGSLQLNIKGLPSIPVPTVC